MGLDGYVHRLIRSLELSNDRHLRFFFIFYFSDFQLSSCYCMEHSRVFLLFIVHLTVLHALVLAMGAAPHWHSRSGVRKLVGNRSV